MLIASCINIGPKKEGKIMNTNTSFCMQIEEEEEEKKTFEEKRCASSFVDQTGCYF
jgi:hypothetical protein